MTRVSSALADRVVMTGDLGGYSPLSVAGACIYMSSSLLGFQKTITEISKVARVGNWSIQVVYEKLHLERKKLVDPEWIKDGNGDMRNLPRP